MEIGVVDVDPGGSDSCVSQSVVRALVWSTLTGPISVCPSKTTTRRALGAGVTPATLAKEETLPPADPTRQKKAMLPARGSGMGMAKLTETLVFVVTGGEGDQKITGVLIDPDQKSAMPSREAFSDPAKRDAWRFRLAVHLYPRKQVFYDTDGDGKIDLILIDSKDSGTPDAQLTLTGDKWVRSAAKSKKLLDPTLLKLSDESRDRLERILKKVGK